MSNKYYNPFIRLKEYLSLMSDPLLLNPYTKDYIGISIQGIFDYTDIPINIIRTDISTMYDGINIMIDDEAAITIETEKTYNLFELEQKEICKLFKSGKLDNIPLYCNFTYQYEDTYQINVSMPELKFLSDFMNKEKSDIHPQNNLYIKDSFYFNPAHKTLYENLQLVNDAISNKKTLKMRYQINSGQMRIFTFIPYKIIYDAKNNLYSILSVYNSNIVIYNFENIREIHSCNENMKLEDTSTLDIIPHVWGNEFSADSIYVKVKFYNENDVWKKVYHDLALKKDKKLYEKNGFLYYEDIVYGKNSFRSWIYSFKESAIVIEPLSLREEIIASLKERLD